MSVAVTLCAPGMARAYLATPPAKESLYQDGQTGRYLLGGGWLFRADFQDVGLAQRWWQEGASTAGWSALTIPNAFNAGDFSQASFDGWVGWYRRDFRVPRGAFAAYVPASARRWIIRFESVNYEATVWLNGRLIGQHVGSNLPFEFELPNVRPGVNRLVVRVDNRLMPWYLPPGPGGGWWNYGGILREVYLRTAQRADISQVQVRPVLRCPSCAARVQERVVVRNVTGAPQAVSLKGDYGSVPLDFGGARIPPHASWTATASALLAHPRLWSLDRPALYRATLTLSDSSGKRLGGYVTYSGIRSIAVTAGGRLTLNGRPLNLRGVEVREQDIRDGGALDPAQMRRLIGWVKALGARVIRADPLDPEIEEMADRAGILIWSDIPVSQGIDEASPYRPGWLASASKTLKDNIEANQNHPSVLLWSIGNELPTPATGSEAAYIAHAVALAHRLDPTRPAAMAVSDWPGVPCQAAYAPLDVIGVNEYFGWYDAGAGSTDDRDALGPFLDGVRDCYPHQALFISEFGFDGSRSGPVEERGTYQFQANAVAYHLGVLASKRWLSGAMYFLLQDSVSLPGYTGGNPWPLPPFMFKGLVDFQGHPKPAWSTVASSYRRTPQIEPGR